MSLLPQSAPPVPQSDSLDEAEFQQIWDCWLCLPGRRASGSRQSWPQARSRRRFDCLGDADYVSAPVRRKLPGYLYPVSLELSQGIFGPTEIRILLAIGNLAGLRSPYSTVLGCKLLLFDVGGTIAALSMLAIVIVLAIRHTQELYREERTV